MRFIVIVKATKDSEAGVLPDEKLLNDMTKYNEELVKNGVMLAGEGLQPARTARASASPATSVPSSTVRSARPRNSSPASGCSK